MQIIFSQGSRNIENIPPIEFLINDHIVHKKSAAYQAGQCWSESKLKNYKLHSSADYRGGFLSMSCGGPRGPPYTRGCQALCLPKEL